MRWLLRLLGLTPRGDVYVLIDEGHDNADDAVLGVFARRQGADLAAIEYAQRVGPLDYPATGSERKSIEMAYRRLVIVNRDVEDDD